MRGRGSVTVLIACFLPLAIAQAPAPARSNSESQLSPQDAYERAVRPLEITRRSPQNWSEVELKALKMARENAKTECLARGPERLVGTDLLALAHLCAFALQWENVHRAASIYISVAQNSDGAGSPKRLVDLAAAFDYKIQSSLNLKNVDEAITDCQTMVRIVPYGVFTSEATNSTIDAIRLMRIDQALALLKQRQPVIISLIQGREPSGLDGGNTKSSPPSVEPSLPLHTLYADAIALPSLQQFANQEKAAADSFSQLESVLPVILSSNDEMYIEQQRRQYRLLGEHLPTLNPMGFLLFSGASLPQGIDTLFFSGAVFLLFPDWCNQCIAMGPDATQKGRELVADHNVRFFILMAQEDPPEKPPPAPVRSVPLSPKAAKTDVARGQQLHVNQQMKVTSDPDTLLHGTPTVVVPIDTLKSFAATDFPLIVATDHNGLIRWVEHAPDNVLDPDGDIDQIVKHILACWPPDADRNNENSACAQ